MFQISVVSRRFAFKIFASSALIALLGLQAVSPSPAFARDAQDAKTASSRIAINKVERFSIPGEGSVNTYWLHTKNGLIVVDFQRDTESAAKAISAIQAVSKPVLAMLLTHPHPDHIGGMDQFRKAFPQTPMFASQASVDEIKNDTTGYLKMGEAFLKEKAPKAYPLPDRILKDRDRFVVDGLVIESRELGAGEAVNATVFHVPSRSIVFTGDIVANEMEDFMLEGRTSLWLKQLDKLSQQFSKANLLYPGHGAPAKPSVLISKQRNALNFVRREVNKQIKAGQWNGKELTTLGANAVAKAVQARYPGHLPVAPIGELSQRNAQGVAREMMSDQAGSTR